MSPLIVHVFNISIWKGFLLSTKLMLTMGEVTARATLATKSLHKILTQARLKLIVKRGKDGT